MGGLAIAASRLGRRTHVWTALALTAAAMLGWPPELAWDVGFQLSFAGPAAIILLTAPIGRRVAFLPHVPRKPFAVTCAAQVGTLPMMATAFHVLSPIAPIANALTLPILPALVAAGLLLGAISSVPDAARIVAIPITALVAYIEQVAFVLAKVPSAAIAIPTFPTWIGLAYYSALGPAIAGAKASGNRRKLAFTMAVAAGQAGAPLRIAGFPIQVLPPEHAAPGDITGAADLAFRAVAPDGRSFCDLSDLDADAQTVAASRLSATCSNLLLPVGGRSALSPDLERAAVDSTTQLIASRGAGRLSTGFPPTVLRTDQERTITLPL